MNTNHITKALGDQELRAAFVRGAEVRCYADAAHVDRPWLRVSEGGIHICFLAHFDLDWQNYYFIQAWDHGAIVRSWEYLLLFNSAKTGWVPVVVRHWMDRPSFAEVGRIVDKTP